MTSGGDNPRAIDSGDGKLLVRRVCKKTMRHLAIALLACCSILGWRRVAADWPPPPLAGVWSVTSVSLGGDPKGSGVVKLMVLLNGRFIVVERLGSAHVVAHKIKHRRADQTTYDAYLQIPTTTVLQDGSSRNEKQKVAIGFSIDRGENELRRVTVKIPDWTMELHAERLNKRKAVERVDSLLLEPNLRCPKDIRDLFENYVSSK